MLEKFNIQSAEASGVVASYCKRRFANIYSYDVSFWKSECERDCDAAAACAEVEDVDGRWSAGILDGRRIIFERVVAVFLTSDSYRFVHQILCLRTRNEYIGSDMKMVAAEVSKA